MPIRNVSVKPLGITQPPYVIRLENTGKGLAEA